MRNRAMVCMAALGAALLAIPAGASATEPDGAPKKATVKFESLLGIPADGYSLVCPPGIPSCTTSGTIDLGTEAEVPVAYSKNVAATYGQEVLFSLLDRLAGGADQAKVLPEVLGISSTQLVRRGVALMSTTYDG